MCAYICTFAKHAMKVHAVLAAEKEVFLPAGNIELLCWLIKECWCPTKFTAGLSEGHKFLLHVVRLNFKLEAVPSNHPTPPHPSLSLSDSCLTSLLFLRLETLSFDTFESNGQTLLACLPSSIAHSIMFLLTCYLPHLNSVVSEKSDCTQLVRLLCDVFVLIWFIRKSCKVIKRF